MHISLLCPHRNIYLPNLLFNEAMYQINQVQVLNKEEPHRVQQPQRFFFTYSPATFTINPSLCPLSMQSLSAQLSVKSAEKHKWGSSIITSHKVTNNLVIHWRSTTVSRQTSMSDSNRLWCSLYVLFLFFTFTPFYRKKSTERSLRRTSKGKTLSPLSLTIYRITFIYEAFEKEIGEMNPILKLLHQMSLQLRAFS